MYLDFKENQVGPIQSVVSGGGAGTLPGSVSPPATLISPTIGSVSHLSPQAFSDHSPSQAVTLNKKIKQKKKNSTSSAARKRRAHLSFICLSMP